MHARADGQRGGEGEGTAARQGSVRDQRTSDNYLFHSQDHKTEGTDSQEAQREELRYLSLMRSQSSAATAGVSDAEVSQCTHLQKLIPVARYICLCEHLQVEMNSKNEEVAALEALRDSSAELVKYLDAMNDKLVQLNQQNELSLRVLENWSSVIAITKATTSSDKNNGGPNEILRKAL